MELRWLLMIGYWLYVLLGVIFMAIILWYYKITKTQTNKNSETLSNDSLSPHEHNDVIEEQDSQEKISLATELRNSSVLMNNKNKHLVGIYVIMLNNDYYIGSTKNKYGFAMRWSQHQTEVSKVFRDIQKFGSLQMVYEIGKWETKPLYPKLAELMLKHNKSIKDLEFRILNVFSIKSTRNEIYDAEYRIIDQYKGKELGLNTA